MNQLMELNDDQRIALDGILVFVDSGHQGEFTLGGYAGTGKSFLISEVIEELRKRGIGFVVLTPTWKSALVLRDKGVPARTFHSYVYNYAGSYVDEDDNEQILFDPKEMLDSTSDLVIVDEASMINGTMVDDIRAHNVRILWVGDHGQLPPVGRDPKLMENLNARLERIVRQSDDSPILEIAHHVRRLQLPGTYWAQNKDRIDRKELFVGKAGSPSQMAKFAFDNEITQTVVPFNDYRRHFNRRYRELLGRTEVDLELGEKLICTKNNYRKAIYNGMMLYVISINEVDEKKGIAIVDLQDENGLKREHVPISIPVLRGEDPKSDEIPSGVNSFEYGYSITCHKAQGSEWDSVLVVDIPSKAWKMERWRYTAYTRAKSRLIVAVGD